MSNKRMFSSHCIVIIPVSHPVSGATRKLTENVFISNSRAGKQSTLGPWVDQSSAMGT